MKQDRNSVFLSNHSETRLLDKVKDELSKCNSFVFSISFIKKAGLSLLKEAIESALRRGCKGKLLTSSYQNFTDIESLLYFNTLQSKYENFECHFDFHSLRNNHAEIGFHTKGYLFEIDGGYEFVIGSSNITRNALLNNVEWNLLVCSEIETALSNEILMEFKSLWQKTYLLTDKIIEQYKEQLNYSIERWDMDFDVETNKFKPNFMQKKALKELARFRCIGEDKAMIISAAGSGKTFLAAFDAYNFMPKHLLYVVHEGSILSKSLLTFKAVFGNERTLGLYNGEFNQIEADFIFASNVMMAKNHDMFPNDYFDYIIIDECHHAVAESYAKIINYFKPEFMLGLTATPERMDKQDVFSIFKQNVPYELRLRDAIVNGLVVPFHYYGIRDKLINYDLNKVNEQKLINEMSDVKHIAFIKEEIEKHRLKNEKLKALVFCRNKAHAKQIANALEEYYHTCYLIGENDIIERQKRYEQLQDESNELEILCSVDILNEGVDIPGVNMVIFLRPTESSTIFIQQLGRGLRKYPNKEYVTVLDFIGNSYKRCVQIALSLGSLASNLVLEKKLLGSLIENDFSVLGLNDYGVKIDIDSLSKEEIINYINNENFNALEYVKKDYLNFKKYINTASYPKHVDYLSEYAPDITRFMKAKYEGKRCRSYYVFIKEIMKEDVPAFTARQIEVINYMSDLLPLSRKHEFVVIEELVHNKMSFNDLIEKLDIKKNELEHCLRYLIKHHIILLEDEVYDLNCEIDDEFKEYVTDLVSYCLSKYVNVLKDDFVLWENYSINGVQRNLLNDPNYNAKGTYFKDNKVIIFASINKGASIEEHLNYKDKFLSKDIFQWESENFQSNTIENINKFDNSVYAYVFIRKMKEEDGIILPFTYVGKGKLTNRRNMTKMINGKQCYSYLFDIMMENELPEELQYDFGVGK